MILEVVRQKPCAPRYTFDTLSLSLTYLRIKAELVELALHVAQLPLQLIAALDVAHVATLEGHELVVQLPKPQETCY